MNDRLRLPDRFPAARPARELGTMTARHLVEIVVEWHLPRLASEAK
jgi:hypothetical protein